MGKEVKCYEPDQRRYLENNLQCFQCGNTNAFFITLKLKHNLSINDSFEIILQTPTQLLKNMEKSIQRNAVNIIDRSTETDNPKIKCSNCEDWYVEHQESILEYCWQTGCPGCWTCGNYISKEDLIETCTSCINDRGGLVNQNYCQFSCPEYESGLEQVMNHYGLTLNDLKTMAGY